MALQAYMPALQGAGHKASAQQIQECGGILSVLLQEKKEAELQISTSFVRKGRAAKDEPLRKVLRSELSKERATRLEEASALKSNITRSQG